MLHEEWKTEPDASDGESETYPTALRRGPGKHWCGYVGLPPGHPWHGKEYGDRVPTSNEQRDREVNLDKVGIIALFCEAGRQNQEEDTLPIELLLNVHGGITFAGHLKDTDKDLWWFGFDCAHSGDYCPAYEHTALGDGVYRNLAYVKAEVESLAKQLKGIENESKTRT